MCCDAMRATMAAGDQIVTQPAGGRGASLTVRYGLPRSARQLHGQTLGTTRKFRVEERVQRLIADFDHYLNWYDEHVPFDRPDQLNSHIGTISRRLMVGTAAAAATDPEFCQNLYRTLQRWGIGQRGSRLVSRESFEKAVALAAPEIAKLDGTAIDDPSLDADGIAAQLWSVIHSLTIVENKANLVPCTKALHHLLPDLVVPMDREYTRTFFGLHAPEFQGHGRTDGQRSVFTRMFCALVRIAQATNPQSYVGAERPWRTSRTKVLDNAIVGFCMAEGLKRPS